MTHTERFNKDSSIIIIIDYFSFNAKLCTATFFKNDMTLKQLIQEQTNGNTSKILRNHLTRTSVISI